MQLNAYIFRFQFFIMSSTKLTQSNIVRRGFLIALIGISVFFISSMVLIPNLAPVTAQSNPSSDIRDSILNNASHWNQTLGDPFYLENTKSTNMRVLNVESIPTVEVSYVGNSTINGSPTQTIGTIIDKMDADGAVHSKGQAIILTVNGQVITYKSESKGYYNPDGSFSDNGIMTFSIPFQGDNANNTIYSDISHGDNVSKFNDVFGIYKKTVDPMGNGFTQVWKWG